MISDFQDRAYRYYARFGRFPCRLAITREYYDLLVAEIKESMYLTSIVDPDKVPETDLFMGIPLDIVDVV